MPENITSTSNNYHFLKGGGEMGELIRSVDWAATPLGPVDSWPAALKLAASIMLSTPFPMYIAWGKEYIQLYNDGYRPILGASKHPQAMGISTRETFAEIWHIIESMFDGVMLGEAVGFPNFMLPLDRNGYVEECYFDFSYSPIYNADGTIGGVLVTVIEITEKLKTFNALKASEKELALSQAETQRQRDRLKGLFMQAPAGICILDGPGLVFELINPAYQQLLPGRELIGRPIFEALPELIGQPIEGILRKTYTSGKPTEAHELCIPVARIFNGPLEERYFNFVYQPRLNAAGETDGLIVFVFEVTDTVISRRIAEESESRFRAMIEQSPVPMLVTRGENLVFDEINLPMLELIGKDKSVIGKPAYEAMPELKGQSIMEKLHDIYLSGEEWTGFEQAITIEKNGERVPGYYNISYKALIENGRITGVLQSAIDVTEQVNAREQLKQSAENFKLLADNISQLAWMTDETGWIFWYNQRWYDYTGTTLEKMQGWGWQSVQHPEHMERVIKKWTAYIQQADIWEDTFPLKGKDGEYRWFLSRAVPLKDDNGKVLRWFGTNTDITEQRKLEQQKDDFISIASHELKTPVTTLKASLQLLNRMKDKPSPMLPKLIEQANKSSDKVNSLIDDLLNVSKLNHGQLHLNKSLFTLSKLVQDCCTHIRLEGAYKITTTGDLELEVFADPDRINQVLVNFANNAVKYAAGSKEIIINIQRAGDKAKVSVIDKGPGIPPEKMLHLFDRYYRVDPNGIQYSGLGLGLYISAEIIKKHKGKIGVQSVIGEGSTFWFKIPVAG